MSLLSAAPLEQGTRDALPMAQSAAYRRDRLLVRRAVLSAQVVRLSRDERGPAEPGALPDHGAQALPGHHDALDDRDTAVRHRDDRHEPRIVRHRRMVACQADAGDRTDRISPPLRRSTETLRTRSEQPQPRFLSLGQRVSGVAAAGDRDSRGGQTLLNLREGYLHAASSTARTALTPAPGGGADVSGFQPGTRHRLLYQRRGRQLSSLESARKQRLS